MLLSGSFSDQIRQLKKWPKESAYWAPNPKHVLKINPLKIQESKRSALLYRRHVVENKFNFIKAGLLRVELDNVLQEHLKNTEAITNHLNVLQDLTDTLSAPANLTNNAEILPEESNSPAPEANKQDHTTTVTVAPGDSGFTFIKSLREEFFPGLYVASNNWLPSYGPWYTAMTANAMQRRVFPKELKGTTNLKNSTSLKLIMEVLDTVASINEDFYTDERNLSDLNAALCILNGYYCKVGNHSPPKMFWDLFDNLSAKINFLIDGLKASSGSADDGFKFSFSNNLQKVAIAPLNNDTRYSKDFFAHHKIYKLLVSSNVIFTADTAKIPGLTDGVDYIYVITSSIFGDNIPPFAHYQLNLRTGIKCLEYLILVYLTLANSQISKPHNRRLQLKTLMGASFEQNISTTLFKRDQVFHFLIEEYVKPIIKQTSAQSSTELFPGLALVALESGDIFQFDATKHFVNLAGTKFTKIFNVINQKLLFKDARELIMAKSELRVALEDGLAAVLSSISPVDTITNTIKRQFGGGDDYDSLYFLVLGCLPVSMAVV
ncbi:tegument protein [Bovine gammaherpesvirus 6]|uniref:Tegument protein n=1 Tax=Bovine gammaherpesvirus 6 TaxID=1504288 RepID=A0A060D2Z2_9GAMA|nr:tegument protein [Bovine gammaherpesvirus 6]AIB03174.1 tegument protein [Bovine gammaherpesvirus 6]